MEQKQNELMKRDLDRFAQNLSRHDARMKSGLQSLATEKAEIEKLCELRFVNEPAQCLTHRTSG